MRVPPLLRLATTHPELLGEHVQAYAELLGEELGAFAAVLKTNLLLGLAALCLVGLGVVFGGVAVMLWAAVATPRIPWVLVACPAAPFLFAGVCLLLRQRRPEQPLAGLKAQLANDVSMLRGVGVLAKGKP